MCSCAKLKLEHQAFKAWSWNFDSIFHFGVIDQNLTLVWFWKIENWDSFLYQPYRILFFVSKYVQFEKFFIITSIQNGFPFLKWASSSLLPKRKKFYSWCLEIGRMTLVFFDILQASLGFQPASIPYVLFFLGSEERMREQRTWADVIKRKGSSIHLVCLLLLSIRIMPQSAPEENVLLPHISLSLAIF